MKTSHTVEHEIKFSVQYFHNAEGGMDTEQFGTDVETLNEALHLLGLARVSYPEPDWRIVCDVETKVKK